MNQPALNSWFDDLEWTKICKQNSTFFATTQSESNNQRGAILNIKIEYILIIFYHKYMSNLIFATCDVVRHNVMK